MKLFFVQFCQNSSAKKTPTADYLGLRAIKCKSCAYRQWTIASCFIGEKMKTQLKTYFISSLLSVATRKVFIEFGTFYSLL